MGPAFYIDKSKFDSLWELEYNWAICIRPKLNKTLTVLGLNKEKPLSPEDWLKKHCKLNDWARLEECLNDTLWTGNVIKYMSEYVKYVKSVELG